PSGKSDSTNAFQEAIDTIKSQNGGLIIEIPGGEFKLSRTLDLYYRIILKGPGTQYSTVLDFCDQKKGPGIVMSGYGQAGIEGLLIKNTASNGVEIRDSNQVGDHRNFFYVQDVAVEDAGECGFFVKDAYMSNFNRCWSRRASKFGFYLAGFQTSIKLDTCFASNSRDTGIYLNDTIYSSLINCGSDTNGSYGYFLSNCQSIAISGCGAEGNHYSSIGMAATKDWAENTPHEHRSEISGITIQSFFSLHGNKSNHQDFGHYMTLFAEDGKRIIGSSHNHHAIPPDGYQHKEVVKRGSDSKRDIRFPIYRGGDLLA
ncbi:MAG: right-handed parallel beta-helix repeat-containing protein, partial [Lewinella sp.]|nr:right-handed parallel beta-helix repeat-containing protein [Lewinella sp.]